MRMLNLSQCRYLRKFCSLEHSTCKKNLEAIYLRLGLGVILAEASSLPLYVTMLWLYTSLPVFGFSGSLCPAGMTT